MVNYYSEKSSLSINELIENNLELMKLERLKTPSAWEIISVPTIDKKPVFPKKKNNTLNYENSKKIIDMFLSGKKKNKNLKFTILRATSIYGHRLGKDKIIKKLLLNCQ